MFPNIIGIHYSACDHSDHIHVEYALVDVGVNRGDPMTSYVAIGAIDPGTDEVVEIDEDASRRLTDVLRLELVSSMARQVVEGMEPATRDQLQKQVEGLLTHAQPPQAPQGASGEDDDVPGQYL